jgi:hypothetical protein
MELLARANALTPTPLAFALKPTPTFVLGFAVCHRAINFPHSDRNSRSSKKIPGMASPPVPKGSRPVSFWMPPVMSSHRVGPLLNPR